MYEVPRGFEQDPTEFERVTSEDLEKVVSTLKGLVPKNKVAHIQADIINPLNEVDLVPIDDLSRFWITMTDLDAGHIANIRTSKDRLELGINARENEVWRIFKEGDSFSLEQEVYIDQGCGEGIDFKDVIAAFELQGTLGYDNVSRSECEQMLMRLRNTSAYQE